MSRFTVYAWGDLNRQTRYEGASRLRAWLARWLAFRAGFKRVQIDEVRS